ncbi:hypothetical protein SBRY_110117 [Actinacidiphila bryophytorum]|uniref:Uncharacterized protein n=1 Tax=Actinacidiphila bryophytorum TaxID=1436133 RepID=A0A9W4E2M7_9ACTN|nr:hypothetical protein SBRY_110117 [Actinacidiphila bryophytorum]
MEYAPDRRSRTSIWPDVAAPQPAEAFSVGSPTFCRYTDPLTQAEHRPAAFTARVVQAMREAGQTAGLTMSDLAQGGCADRGHPESKEQTITAGTPPGYELFLMGMRQHIQGAGPLAAPADRELTPPAGRCEAPTATAEQPRAQGHRRLLPPAPSAPREGPMSSARPDALPRVRRRAKQKDPGAHRRREGPVQRHLT